MFVQNTGLEKTDDVFHKDNTRELYIDCKM